MKDSEDVEKIVAGLTKRQREKLRCLTSVWEAGPDLPRWVVDQLGEYWRLGLVEREFRDMHEPMFGRGADSLSVRLSACWFFRLTPLGLAVRTRTHLLSTPNAEKSDVG